MSAKKEFLQAKLNPLLFFTQSSTSSKEFNIVKELFEYPNNIDQFKRHLDNTEGFELSLKRELNGKENAVKLHIVPFNKVLMKGKEIDKLFVIQGLKINNDSYMTSTIGMGGAGSIERALCAFSYNKNEGIKLLRKTHNGKNFILKSVSNSYKMCDTSSEAGIAKEFYRFGSDKPTYSVINRRRIQYTLLEEIHGKTLLGVINDSNIKMSPTDTISLIGGCFAQLAEFHKKGYLHEDVAIRDYSKNLAMVNLMYDPKTKKVTLLDFDRSFKSSNPLFFAYEAIGLLECFINTEQGKIFSYLVSSSARKLLNNIFSFGRSIQYDNEGSLTKSFGFCTIFSAQNICNILKQFTILHAFQDSLVGYNDKPYATYTRHHCKRAKELIERNKQLIFKFGDLDIANELNENFNKEFINYLNEIKIFREKTNNNGSMRAILDKFLLDISSVPSSSILDIENKLEKQLLISV